MSSEIRAESALRAPLARHEICRALRHRAVERRVFRHCSSNCHRSVAALHNRCDHEAAVLPHRLVPRVRPQQLERYPTLSREEARRCPQRLLRCYSRRRGRHRRRRRCPRSLAPRLHSGYVGDTVRS